MKIRFSYILALGLAGGIAYYMLNGETIVGGQPIDPAPSISERAVQNETILSVQVENHRALERISELEIRGRTQADSVVSVVAQISGIVQERNVEKGQSVDVGDLLCIIEDGARKARLAHAEAQLLQAETDLAARSSLVENGHVARNQIPAFQADVDSARAAVADAQLDMTRTKVRSPISGIVQDPMAEIGDVVLLGGTCVTVIDQDPMKMIGQVSELDVGKLTVGMEADVDLIGGDIVQGQIVYIAPSADPQTRTFQVEIEVSNADGRIRDGITANARIQLEAVRAHLISSAYLTLNDSGEIGVRAVDSDSVVAFMPVTIISGTREGLWVGGLPDSVDIITVGQEYTVAGQKVRAIPPTGVPLKPNQTAELK